MFQGGSRMVAATTEMPAPWTTLPAPFTSSDVRSPLPPYTLNASNFNSDTAGTDYNSASQRETCPVCWHAFQGRNRHQNLAIHLRIHTGETPYHCSFCSYQAKRKSHLDLHVTRKHASSPKPNSTQQPTNSTVLDGLSRLDNIISLTTNDTNKQGDDKERNLNTLQYIDSSIKTDAKLSENKNLKNIEFQISRDN